MAKILKTRAKVYRIGPLGIGRLAGPHRTITQWSPGLAGDHLGFSESLSVRLALFDFACHSNDCIRLLLV